MNNPLPSPSYRDAVIGTLTNNLSGSTSANPEPELIKDNSKSSSASNGILNKPPPSPMNRDDDIEPLISTELLNCEPLPVLTIKNSPLSTDAVAEPLAIFGDAAACTFVIWLPSPIKCSSYYRF